MEPHARLIRLALAAVLAIGSMVAAQRAAAVYPFTDPEWAMLPEYCHQQGNVSIKHRAQPRSQKWIAYLGADFEHIHHWCAVYMWVGRAYRAGAASVAGRQNLGRAVADMEYFLDRARSDSPLLPEVYTKLEEVYLLQGNIKGAEAAFKRVQEIDPSYWRADFLWAHNLFKRGNKAQALDIAEQGLRESPNANVLKALVDEIKAERVPVKK